MTGFLNLRSRLPTEQWERNVFAVTLAVFIAFSGFTVVIPFLPLYVRELGVRDPSEAAIWAGLVFGVSPFIAGLLAPFWGTVADKYGRKPVFIRSLIAFVILMVLYGFVQNVQQLFALRVLHGVFGGFGAMAMSMISVSAPESRAGSAIGRLQAVMLLTNASGPLAGGVLASTIGIRNTFFVATGLTVIALLTVVFYYREDKSELRRSRRQKERTSFRSLLLLPILLPLAGVLFLSQFVDRSLSPVLPLFIEDLGATPASAAFFAGLLTSGGAVASAAAAAVVGRLAVSRGVFPLLLASLVGGAIATLAMTLVQTVPQLLAARVALGLLAGGTVTLAYALGAAHLPRESRGATFGLLSTGMMVGGGLSPFVAGLLAAVDIRLVFIVGGGVYALSAIVSLRLPRPPSTAAEEATLRDAAPA